MVEKLPRSVLIALSVGCLVISGAWIRTASADIRQQNAVNIDQEARIKILERSYDKIDDKLDRIGERLGVKAV